MAESIDMEKVLLSGLSSAHTLGLNRQNNIADMAAQNGMTIQQTVTHGKASNADDAQQLMAHRAAVFSPVAPTG